MARITGLAGLGAARIAWNSRVSGLIAVAGILRARVGLVVIVAGAAGAAEAAVRVV